MDKLHDYKTAQQLVSNESSTATDDLYSRLPERRLLAAVLERAVLDLHHQDKHIRRSAELWFENKDLQEVWFSYKYVCNYLNLDYIRIKQLSYSRRTDIMRAKYK